MQNNDGINYEKTKGLQFYQCDFSKRRRNTSSFEKSNKVIYFLIQNYRPEKIRIKH